MGTVQGTKPETKRAGSCHSSASESMALEQGRCERTTGDMCIACLPLEEQTLGRHAALARPHVACQQAYLKSWTCQRTLDHQEALADPMTDKVLMTWAAQLSAEGNRRPPTHDPSGYTSTKILPACPEDPHNKHTSCTHHLRWHESSATSLRTAAEGHQQASVHKSCA